MHSKQDTVNEKDFCILYFWAFRCGGQSNMKFKYMMGIYSMIWKRQRSNLTFSAKITEIFILLSCNILKKVISQLRAHVQSTLDSRKRNTAWKILIAHLSMKKGQDKINTLGKDRGYPIFFWAGNIMSRVVGRVTKELFEH